MVAEHAPDSPKFRDSFPVRVRAVEAGSAWETRQACPLAASFIEMGEPELFVLEEQERSEWSEAKRLAGGMPIYRFTVAGRWWWVRGVNGVRVYDAFFREVGP